MEGTNWADAYKAFQGAHREAELRGLRIPSVLAMLRDGWLSEREPTGNDAGTPIYGALARKFDLTLKGSLKLKDLEPDDFVSDSKKLDVITVEFMLDAIEDRYMRDIGWVMLREWQPGSTRESHGRRIDAFLFNRLGMRAKERIAFEVKRSRADFKKELEDPTKSEPTMRFATEFFFVCPTGIIKPEEVPDPYGLIYIGNEGATRIRKHAVKLPDNPPSWGLVGAIIRAVMRDEHKAIFDRTKYD